MTPQRKSEEPSEISSTREDSTESSSAEPQPEAPEQSRERTYPPLSEKQKERVLNEVERSYRAGAVDVGSVKRTRSKKEDM